MIEFACPHCRAALAVADDQAGGPTRCRRCRQLVPVPGKAAGAPAPLPAAGLPSPSLEEIPIVVRSVRVRMGVGGAIRVLIWALSVLWTLGVLFWYGHQQDQAETVFQQFKLAAEAGLAIAAGFVIARAIEGITRAVSGQ